jgi:hypothetical protein
MQCVQACCHFVRLLECISAAFPLIGPFESEYMMQLNSWSVIPSSLQNATLYLLIQYTWYITVHFEYLI